MTTATQQNMEKAKQITDLLLGKEGMSKYPSMLLVGLLLIACSLKRHLKRL